MQIGSKRQINRNALKRVREIERHNRREAKLDRRAERELQRRVEAIGNLPESYQGIARTLNRGGAL